ncbi:enoyl-CoA hydratase/isomerase family protein [Neurospora tetraspora]|uniref:Enoyl-CoA hydratase/isomerase family protein n=1 Tax=Neurospora tetraspora TaxID=94610 RepID=A0AAE0JGR2_9PEZI|nr:enoyl-CoA hydratase/isomerase family protein [Neurospora tetraspora]
MISATSRLLPASLSWLESFLLDYYYYDKSSHRPDGGHIVVDQDTAAQPPAPSPWTIVQRHEAYEVAQHESTVRICLDDGPHHHGNSLTMATMRDLTEQFRELSADDAVHRIVVTGRGRFFCTGMDLKEEDLFASVADRYAVLHDFFATIDACPKPTIAVVNGPAFGGGVGLAMVCDVRIALSTASFCLSEVRLGLCPATISKYLIREWGVSLARMAMVTGRRIETQTLHDAGIIHAVASDMASVEKVLQGFLDEMRYAAPQAAALTKTLAREAAIGGDEAHLDKLAGEVFDAMLAPGSESEYGIAQFKRGVKKVIWGKRPREGV